MDVSEKPTASVFNIKYSVVLCIVCVCLRVRVYCVGYFIGARGGTVGCTALQAGGRGFDSRWGPSECTMVLGSTQPLSEMSTRGISWG